MIFRAGNDILLTGLLVVAFSLALIALGIAVTTLVRFWKIGKADKRKTTLVTILCIVAAAISWVLNMGWGRFFLTLLLFPIFHAVVFLLVNLFSMRAQGSKRSRLYFVLLCVTYLLFYFLLPDGSDDISGYVFFGLIVNDTVSSICYVLSTLSGIAHVVLLILQLVEIVRAKKPESTSVPEAQASEVPDAPNSPDEQ